MKILMLEDNINDLKIIQRVLAEEYADIQFKRVSSEDEFLEEIKNDYDVVLSDYSMPEFDGMDALKLRNQHAPLLPFIIVTGSVNELTAVDCMNEGADNYILKEHLKRIIPAIEKAITDKKNLLEKLQANKKLIDISNRYDALIEQSKLGIIIESIDGSILYSNEQADYLFDLDADSKIEVNIRDLVFKDNKSTQHQVFDALNTNYSNNFEIDFDRNGVRLWLNVHIEPFHEMGVRRGYQYIIRNITDSKNEQIVVEAINRLARKALIGSDLEAFIAYSFEVIREFINCNNYFVALYNKEKKCYNFLFHADEEDEIDLSRDYVLENGLTDFVRISGEPLLANNDFIEQLYLEQKIEMYGSSCKIWLGVPLFDNDEVIGVIGMQDYQNAHVLGNNELVFMERFSPWVSMKIKQDKVFIELAEREKRFFNLFHDSPSAIVVHQDGIIKMANPAANALGKLTSNQSLVGKEVLSFVDNSYSQKVSDRINLIVEKGIGQPPLIEKLITSDGSDIYAEVTAIPFEFDRRPASQVIMRDVTAEYEAKKQLLESEEKFRVTFKTSLDVITITEMETGIYAEVNDAFYSFTGYNQQEIIGNSSFKINIWNNVNDRAFLVDTIHKQGFIANYQTEFIMKNGKVEQALVSGRIIMFEHKRYIILMSRIITDFVEMSKKIETSEQKFNQIFNSASDVFILYKINGGMTFFDCNKSFENLYGYSKEEVFGKDVSLIVDEKYAAVISNNVNNLKQDKSVIFESYHVKKDGSLFPVEVSAKRIFIGDVEFILAIERDITQTLDAKNALLESEEKFRLGFKASPDAMAIFNIETLEPLEINNSFELLTGFGLNNWPNDRLISPLLKDELRLNSFITSLLESSELRNFEIEIDNQHSGHRHILISAMTLVLKEKQHMMLILKDITDIKEIQNQLETAMVKAEESDKLKSAFLANMSHEIRTPMNHIIGFTEIIKQGVDAEDLKSYIEIIQRSSNHLLALINDIIDISKVEAGQVHMEIREINPGVILKEIFESYKYDKRLTEKPDIQLHIETRFNANHKILADKTRLMQVIINLVTNALKFTQRGNISMGYDMDQSGYARFFVKDSGIGISKDQLAVIFERFRQAENAQKIANEGTGLGLALSKAYVEMMGGKIWVDSVLNEGSIFSFTIPVLELNNLSNSVINSISDFKVGLFVADKTDEFLLKTFFRGVLSENQIIKIMNSDLSNLNNFQNLKVLFVSIGKIRSETQSLLSNILNQVPQIKVIGLLDYLRQSEDQDIEDMGFYDFVSKPLSRDKIANIIARFMIESGY